MRTVLAHIALNTMELVRYTVVPCVEIESTHPSTTVSMRRKEMSPNRLILATLITVFAGPLAAQVTMMADAQRLAAKENQPILIEFHRDG
jgi:hypothetical protein